MRYPPGSLVLLGTLLAMGSACVAPEPPATGDDGPGSQPPPVDEGSASAAATEQSAPPPVSVETTAPTAKVDDMPALEQALEAEHPAMRGAAMLAPLPTASPPPIQGGTLLIATDRTAIVSDPDSDAIHFVALEEPQPRTVQLVAGSEPGRLAEDGAGRVHVVLRRAGVLVTLDIASATELDRRPVCPAPHGVAYQASADLVHVVCESGELVTLPAAGGVATRVRRLMPGMRDVVVEGDRLRVSHFKSATVYELDADGTVLNGLRPPTVSSNRFGGGLVLNDGTRPRRMEAAVAWRARVAPARGTLLVHQRAFADEIDIEPEDPNSVADPLPPADPLFGPGGLQGSPYGGGGGGGCDSIVQTTVSVIKSDGAVWTTPALVGATLPVDAALAQDGTLALVSAGLTGLEDPADPAAPRRSLFLLKLSELLKLGSGECVRVNGGTPGAEFFDAGQAVGVAFHPDGTVLVHSRNPNRLSLFRRDAVTGSVVSTYHIPLGPTRVDAGHDIYHLDAGAQVTCASCHPGGADDGRSWLFSGLGPRRSQSSNVGLEGTAPFHWDGTLPDVASLVDEVFVHRMGGRRLSDLQQQALERWLFALRPPAAIRAPEDAAVQRGRALFESQEVGCAECHSGDKFTNNELHDVGTGEAFQVPSLTGVGYRLPLMHDGCARSLRTRFDPACGGAAHGQTAQLDESEIGDLAAYLESL